ncbi:putative major capsid protein [Rhizobium phage RHph_TM1_7A]|nr:putative major capsid protein [Rhizobium phage RHph_TM1_7A]
MPQLSANDIRNIARTNTTPIPIARSTRQINQIVATSMPAGKMVPVTAFPLLREDQLRNSMIHCKVDLMETAEIIKNGIKCRFMAYFVPFLAFDRFNGGMDEFNRSYMKQTIADGATVTPFFNTMVAGAAGSIPIHKYLGFHAAATDTINTAYIEAYNLIWNFRARNRSETLYQAKKRLSTATSLAPAFWQHEQFKYVVPDWDDVAMEGSVDLSFTSAKVPVYGIGFDPTVAAQAGSVGSIRHATGVTDNVNNWNATAGYLKTKTKGVAGQIFPDIYADLQASGVKISLANIELAKRTQWYADLKAHFEGLPDSWIIDMLMQGISVPDQMWKQPILIADKTEIFGIEKRWATDGANLTDAVVNGAAMCDLDMVLPRTPTGGIVMIVAEILPEQLFERGRDPLLFTTDPAKLPNALKDDLDPQKVERMSKGEIDTSHSDPNGLFGYRPLNWQWQQSNTRIGGKWFKSAPSNTFNEDRQHFWTVEVTDPAYNSDFMISEVFNTLPFIVTNQDVGEVQLQGTAIIEGNTQFGTRLLENDNAYAEVIAQVDQTRLTKGV